MERYEITFNKLGLAAIVLACIVPLILIYEPLPELPDFTLINQITLGLIAIAIGLFGAALVKDIEEKRMEK